MEESDRINMKEIEEINIHGPEHQIEHTASKLPQSRYLMVMSHASALVQVACKSETSYIKSMKAFQNLESELFDPNIIDESGQRSGRPKKNRIK